MGGDGGVLNVAYRSMNATMGTRNGERENRGEGGGH